jgi:hypothetical protein
MPYGRSRHKFRAVKENSSKNTYSNVSDAVAMAKKNCWEVKKCGREPGGAKVKELGVCAASTEKRTDGINEGKNAGRACWGVTGTLCGGKTQGSFASKMANCMECDFYKEVKNEEGAKMIGVKTILEKLR